MVQIFVYLFVPVFYTMLIHKNVDTYKVNVRPIISIKH